MGTIVLLDLMGGVASLLWGLHMVQSGAMPGSDLRRLLAQAFRNRFAAFGVVLALTAVLQSSTATGLMTASFAAEGLVGLPALAIMLGANVGTALIVQILSFNVAAAALRRPWPWRMHPARRCAWAMR
jgi:phosphate:Na+ symporter